MPVEVTGQPQVTILQLSTSVFETVCLLGLALTKKAMLASKLQELHSLPSGITGTATPASCVGSGGWTQVLLFVTSTLYLASFFFVTNV